MDQFRMNELEMNVDVASTLVAHLDEKVDTDSVEIVRTIMQRVAVDSANPETVRAHAQAVVEAIERAASSDAPEDSMTRVTRALDTLQDDVRMLRLSFPTHETSVSQRQDPAPPDNPSESAPECQLSGPSSVAPEEACTQGPCENSPPAAAEAPTEHARGTYLGFEITQADIIDFVAEAQECVTLAENALIKLESDPKDSAALNEAFRCFHNIKGSSGMLGLVKLQELAHAAESVMGRIREGSLGCVGFVSQALFSAVDVIRSIVRQLKDPSSLELARTSSPEVDRLTQSLWDCLSVSPQRSDLESRARSMSDAGVRPPGGCIVEDSWSDDREPSKQRSDEYVRVRLGRLDSLVDLIGELVIADSMVRNRMDSLGIANTGLASSVSQMSKIMRQLQETALAMRLVPLSGVFSKLSRVARDTSRKLGKDVIASFEGEDTELDRSIVDEISLPLVHMVRNAVDHGIEPPEERLRRGKPRTGHVLVSARHKGGTVIISVEDDGHGLDRAKILAKARALGLIGAEEPDDQAVYRCVFHPGFSTSEQVTEVSGRGVGLDVVKKAVDNLRGRIDIETYPGKGTRMCITVPLSMAIIDGMLVSVGGVRYVIPLHAILEALRPRPGQVVTVGGRQELLDIRSNLVPLIRLRRLFGLPDDPGNSSDSLAVVCSDGSGQCALWIDSLIGQQQVVIKPLGELFRDVPFLSGATVLENGRVGLILDIGGIVRLFRER